MEESPHAKPMDADTAMSGRRRILLADDEALVRAAGCAVLEHLGYEVTGVSDGAEAVAAYLDAREHVPFDAVILDVAMPNRTGLEALRDIRAVNPEAVVILVTGNPPPPDPNAPPEHCPSAYLEKPYRMAAISRLVRECLGEL